MATHSSILAWRILRTEEPGRLQTMGSQRIRHDWVTFIFPLSFKFKGGNPRLLFDISVLPASLLLCFAAIIKQNKGYLNTSTVIPQHKIAHLITQEYRSGLPFPSPEDLPNPGIQPGTPALQVDSLPAEQPGKPLW